MDGPTPVRWFFAIAFLVVSLYCLARVLVGPGHRSALCGGGHQFGLDVDVSHVVMGLGMAAMFSPWGDPIPTGISAPIFGFAALWFAVRLVGDRAEPRRAGPWGRVWPWHHVVEPVAMVYMVIYMARTVPMGQGMDGMPASPLAASIAVALFGYFALFVVWSSVQLVRAETLAPVADGSLSAGPPVMARLVLSPRLAVSCQTVIGIGMAYGFLLIV